MATDEEEFSANSGEGNKKIAVQPLLNFSVVSSSSNNPEATRNGVNFCQNTKSCRKYWQRLQKIRKKSLLCAVVFLFGGLALFVTGAVFFWTSSDNNGLDLLILGSIMLLPGSYGIVIIYGALNGWRGYDAEMISEEG
mmetsp:Transcript_26996/g.37225  ORF Transcript_26996/g.37225 Transcript_26996/m.37225 type:complete len:138 (-) Transcript_26996:166-579(-)